VDNRHKQAKTELAASASDVESDERIADAHDDPACSCDSCARVRLRRESAQRSLDAMVYGGLSPRAAELFGRGWIEEDRKGVTTMPEPIGMPQLAQRAIADVFEQLERVGSAGREKARPYYVSAFPLVTEGPKIADKPPFTRRDALELIRYAENALDYARVHLDYLPRDPAADDAEAPVTYQRGDRVLVADDEALWSGVVVDAVAGASSSLIKIRADNGSVHDVHEQDVRAVPV
jgi:hypothetical protein